MLGWVCLHRISVDLANRIRGGIRGIIELEVLKAIQEHLPHKIPIRNFFDLVVGTR